MIAAEPRSEDKPSAYNAGYAQWKGWDRLFHFNAEEDAYFHGQLHNIRLPGARLLEVGFGSGAFMAWARQRGAHVSGCELIGRLCEEAVARGFDARLGEVSTFADQADALDVVVAFDVLEHIPPGGLETFLLSVKHVLRPGGIFLARVPNGGSPWGLSYQHGDLTHRVAWTPGSFAQLARGADMTLLHCGNAFRPIHPRGVLIDRARYFLRDVVERGVAFLYKLSDVPLDPNIVAVFRKGEPTRATIDGAA